MSEGTFFPITDASFGSELSPEAFDMLAGQYLASLGPNEAVVRPEWNQPKEVRRRKFLAALVAGVQAGLAGGTAVGGGQLSASWEAPAGQLYYLTPRTERAYNVTRVSAQLSAGTCTIQLFKVGSAVGDPIDVTTELTSQVVDLTFAAGDAIRVLVSSVSGAENLCLAIDYE